MPALVWTESFTVRVFETDACGTLAARSFCDWLQEAAGNHARDLGVSVESLIDKGMTWVLSRLRARVGRLPGTGERIAIRTWHSGFERLFSLRDFTVLDERGDVIASAVTAWIMFDTRARRPVRPSTRFEAPDTSAIPRALAANLDRLPGCERPEVETSISVRWSDLDVNRHVNNSRYAEWIAEGAAAALLDGPILASLDIDYLAETQHPGSVVVRTQRDPAHFERLGHAIARAEDGVEAVRARTEWRAR